MTKTSKTSTSNQYFLYSITNIKTEKAYFGRSKLTTTRRFDLHTAYLELGRHSNKPLQADWDRLGSKNFVFTVLETGLSKASAESLETSMILEGNVYNLRKTGRPCLSKPNRIPGRVGNAPTLSQAEVDAIYVTKGTDFGYKIAERFGVSPSLVSLVFNHKYGDSGLVC